MKRFVSAQAAGVAFGVVGMLTGVTSLFLTWQFQSEETAVVLAAYPSASAADLTHEGFAVRLDVVNQSLRPIIVRSASLWRGDRKIGDASGYLTDAKLLDRVSRDPAAISEARLPFPLTLDARAGRALAVLIDVWRPIVNADTPVEERAARRELNQFLAGVQRLPARGGSNVRLRVDRVPGGSQWFPLRSLVVPGTYPEAIKDATAIAGQAKTSFWRIEPVANGRKVTGLLVRRTFAGADQVDLARLTVWKERSLLERSFTRPVLGQQATLFPLQALPDGEYVAAVRVGDRVVSYSSFSLPWRGERCRSGPVSAAPAPSWCGR